VFLLMMPPLPWLLGKAVLFVGVCGTRDELLCFGAVGLRELSEA
jgi:hypothetical protein